MLLTSIWDYQWTKEYVELNQELIKLIYEESQGIIDIAIKIFILAAGERQLKQAQEKISIELIKKVVKEDLKLVQPNVEST